MIYHIALAEDWAKARLAGTYTISTLGRDVADVGFVHCSDAEQAPGVYERFYGAVTEPLVLLRIDPERLTAPLRWDEVPGSRKPFPHVYGPINLDAVLDAPPIGHGTLPL